MELSKENLECLPFVVWGLGRACLEMAIKPAIHKIVGPIVVPSQEAIDELIRVQAGLADDVYSDN